MTRARTRRPPRRQSAEPRACRIEGARTHNLKGISCRIPFGRITAVTGVSGSGKSTLAFDVLYAEGQRRFVDCLSTYARQFLQRLDRPDADFIGEIQPPIALKQQVSIRNARSTVGSITELSDLLHLLFAHAGTAHCPKDGAELVLRTKESAAAELLALRDGSRYALVADVSLPATRRGREGAGLEEDLAAAVAQGLQEQGYARVYRGGEIVDWNPPFRGGQHRLVIDRFVGGKLARGRAVESIEAAWRLGHGVATVHVLGEEHASLTLTEGLSCPSCHDRAQAPRPQTFSPNSPLGACPHCNGFGRIVVVDRDKVVPDPSRSLRGGAIVPFETKTGRGFRKRMLARAAELGISVDVPFSGLDDAQKEWVFTGTEPEAAGGSGAVRGRRGARATVYRGVEGLFRKLERKRYRPHVRIFMARYRGYEPCPRCRGTRLHPGALSVTVGGRDLAELERTPIRELGAFLRSLELAPERRARVRSLLGGVESRLSYLEEVGLGYLTLSRAARTLSGGETQRIRLASGLGTSLTETLYVLDEPTVGLHAVDTARMLSVLRQLCAAGNTVVVVEHDPGIVLHADHLIVLGPSGGENGGQVLFEGPPAEFQRLDPEFFRALEPADGAVAERAHGSSLGEARHEGSGDRSDSAVAPRVAERPVATRALLMRGIREHNLAIDELYLPADRLVVVTGMSGSGKSTLVENVLYRNGLRFYGKPAEDVGGCREIDGLEAFSEILLVSQNPLGRSSRSTLISYTGLLAAVRKRLARTPRARELGLKAGAFSFNVPGGRCESCKGMGTVVLEMHFLADVEVACEACRGRRFRDEVLEVTDRGRSILQILDLTVAEALVAYADDREAQRALQPLVSVGLDYLRLGQNTSTLSGGEAQRLKLASLLAEGGGAPAGEAGEGGLRKADSAGRRTRAPRTTKRKGAADTTALPRIFLFDEPTSGLHPQDIRKLLHALRGLVAMGNAVLVVEHQLDFIRSADWVVDLGPGGGDEGGRVLYSGPVDGLQEVPESITGHALGQEARGDADAGGKPRRRRATSSSRSSSRGSPSPGA